MTPGIVSGVQLYGIQPEMVMCDGVVAAIFRSHSIPCERTSIVGKKHGKGSLHPVGFAVDYRTKHIAGLRRVETIEMIVFDLKAALPCCDIIIEHLGEAQEHIHVEFDPKDDTQFQHDKKWYKRNGNWPRG